MSKNIKPESGNEEEQTLVEQLLRTIRYTNQTNDRLTTYLSAQQKQGNFKLLFWSLPIIFAIFFYLKQYYDSIDFIGQDNGYVSQVVLSGTIQIDSSTASADVVIPALRAAFADPKSKGVLFRISSPGGSPTQSILIHDELVKLQKDYPNKKLAVIGEEGLTSGAYWVASAAKEINVLPSTLTGSIGVIMKSFDFSKLAQKYDVKRLVITAGTNKSRIDQFIEPRPEDIEKLRGITTQLHEQFISIVKDSRGDRLKGEPSELFSGDFWLGEKALELGLVDNVISTSALLNKEFGTDKVKDYSRKPGFLDQVMSKNPLASSAESLLDLYQLLSYSEYPTIN